jgi:hypothetical protein
MELSGPFGPVLVLLQLTHGRKSFRCVELVTHVATAMRWTSLLQLLTQNILGKTAPQQTGVLCSCNSMQPAAAAA